MFEAFLVQGIPVSKSVITSFLRKYKIVFNEHDDPLNLADLATERFELENEGSASFSAPYFAVWYDSQTRQFILGFSVGKASYSSGEHMVRELATSDQLKTRRDFIYNLATFNIKPDEIGDVTTLYLVIQ